MELRPVACPLSVLWNSHSSSYEMIRFFKIHWRPSSAPRVRGGVLKIFLEVMLHCYTFFLEDDNIFLGSQPTRLMVSVVCVASIYAATGSNFDFGEFLVDEKLYWEICCVLESGAEIDCVWVERTWRLAYFHCRWATEIYNFVLEAARLCIYLFSMFHDLHAVDRVCSIL